MDKSNMQADLAIIKNIMEESRQNFYNYGTNLVVWGGLVIIALLLTFMNAVFYYWVPEFWYWFFAFGTGFVFESIQGRRWMLKNKVIQPANKIGSVLWMSILLTMVLYGVFGSVSGTIQSIGASGFIAGLLAIGYLVTGESIKLKWVKRLGYGWWIGAIILFFTTGATNILVMAFLMLVLQFIPGLILLKKGPQND